MVERIDIETFRQITRKELTPGNEFLSWWDPNPVIDHAIKPAVGKLRPWTKAGREYHNFYRNFHTINNIFNHVSMRGQPI